MKVKKTPEMSKAIMTKIVLPNDTNTLGNLMGGVLMHWMDICTAIAAYRHSNRVVVTAGVDSVDFTAHIKLADIVTLESQVTRAFNTSMEVWVRVMAEDPQTNIKRIANTAFFTFVGVDQNNKPIPVDPIFPETEEEKDRYDEALKRREFRLVMSGRMSIEDTTYIKKLYVPEVSAK